MRLCITKVDEFQFLTCVKHSVWGSEPARFKEWNVGDYLTITVDKAIAGLAEVAGEPYLSKKIIWYNGAFPHRIDLKFTHIFFPQNRLPLLGEIREALTSTWGPVYGWCIRNQQVLEGSAAETIIKAIQSKHDDLVEIQKTIDKLWNQAKSQRDTIVSPQRKRGRPKKVQKTLPFNEKSI